MMEDRSLKLLRKKARKGMLGWPVAIAFYGPNLNQTTTPRRAGNKIWGKEQVEAVFKKENNCKDPRWR